MDVLGGMGVWFLAMLLWVWAWDKWEGDRPHGPFE
jgi:hypothetical protein